MPFIAYIRAVEADRFGFQLATAAVEAVLAVIVGKGYALITFQLISIFYNIVIAKLYMV